MSQSRAAVVEIEDAAFGYGGAPLAALEEAGALRIEGDRALATRFVTLFPLPEKAA